MKCFPVLGSAGRHQEIESQHVNSRYTDLIRLCFQQKWIASLCAVSTVLCTPCLNKLMILILNRVIATGLHTRTRTHTHTRTQTHIHTHPPAREHIHTFVASYMHTGIHIVHSHIHPPSHSSMHPSIRPYIHTYLSRLLQVYNCLQILMNQPFAFMYGSTNVYTIYLYNVYAQLGFTICFWWAHSLYG